MTWIVDASGTQTSTANGVEYVLDSPTTNATYLFKADAVNLALGDLMTVNGYDKVDGTNSSQGMVGDPVLYELRFSSVQAVPLHGYHHRGAVYVVANRR